MNHQWNKAGHVPTSGQALVIATFNVVLFLTYEDVDHSNNVRPRNKGSWPIKEEEVSVPVCCTYHHSYIHDIVECKDIALHSK